MDRRGPVDHRPEVASRPFAAESAEAYLVLDHPDVHREYALGLLVVAIGCGTHIERENDDEPSPARESEPASAVSQSPQSGTDPAPSEVGQPPSGPTTNGTGTTCKVGFQKDILPRLVATCGQSACHGSMLNRPFIDADAPQMTHQELMEFQFGSLEWSLGDDHPETPGAAEPAFRTPVDNWRMCGGKLD